MLARDPAAPHSTWPGRIGKSQAGHRKADWTAACAACKLMRATKRSKLVDPGAGFQMPCESIEVLVVGGGQAGLAMSEHLSAADVPHLVLERDRIAERWRTARWDSLVANGPAWHDRFPTLEFDIGPGSVCLQGPGGGLPRGIRGEGRRPGPIRSRGHRGAEARRSSGLPCRDDRRGDRRPLPGRRDRTLPTPGDSADRRSRRIPGTDPLELVSQPGSATQRRRPGHRGGVLRGADRGRAAARWTARIPLRRCPRPPAEALPRA